MNQGEKNHRRWDEGGGKTNLVFGAANVVSVWRPGFPVLRLFVVYIAQAPGNYCTDVTPTRGVWSQIHSLHHNLSRLYRRPDRSECNVYTWIKHTWGYVSPLLSLSLFTVKSLTEPAVRTDMLPLSWAVRALLTLEVLISSRRARISPSVRVVLPPRPDSMRLTRAFREPSPAEKWITLRKVGVSESPESGESGRGAGVEFHSVAGESCCAGVQVFYFNSVHQPLGPFLVNRRRFWKSQLCKILFHNLLWLIQLVKIIT